MIQCMHIFRYIRILSWQLIQIDGDYYYVNSSCKVVTTLHYWVNRPNDLLPAGFYDFGADGKMINPPKEDGKMIET